MRKFQNIFLENAARIFIYLPLDELKQVVNFHKRNIFFPWNPETLDYTETSSNLMNRFGSLLETQFGNAIITICISSFVLLDGSKPMQNTPSFDSSVIFVIVLSCTF